MSCPRKADTKKVGVARSKRTQLDLRRGESMDADDDRLVIDTLRELTRNCATVNKSALYEATPMSTEGFYRSFRRLEAVGAVLVEQRGVWKLVRLPLEEREA